MLLGPPRAVGDAVVAGVEEAVAAAVVATAVGEELATPLTFPPLAQLVARRTRTVAAAKSDRRPIRSRFMTSLSSAH